MTIKLNAPGMTSLHKAGLAGLYLTLRAFEEKGQRINGLRWELEPGQVVLHWSEKTLKASFQSLIDFSFRLEAGFIVLTGLEVSNPLTTDQKHFLYYALLHSFLQRGPDRPTGNKTTLTYEVDDRKCIIKNFAPIKSFPHQKVAKDFFDEEGQLRESVNVASWVYPGGGQRHVVHNNTRLSESTELALALLFAPVGVVYYAIKSRAKGRKARLAMLVPEIKDLAAYAEIRQAFAAQGVLDLTASSPSDAALRMITSIEANRAGNQFAEFFGGPFVCRVITFGIVTWNERQKTRTYARSIFSGQLPGLENYRKAAAIFKNRWQLSKQESKRKGQQESYFIVSSTAREFIAENIAQGQVWYHDLATFTSHREARKGLSYERKELHQMVEQASMSESERTFVNVCHESWRRRMGKLTEGGGKSGEYSRNRIQKEFERLRTSLLRSRNARSLRQTVVDLWGRAGLNEELQGGGLQKLWALFNEQNWRKTRDLALLALISYEPKDKHEAAALSTEATEEGDETK